MRKTLQAMSIAGLMAVGTVATGDDAIELRLSRDSGLRLAASDGSFSTRLGGRIQADGAFYDEDVAALGNGTKIRRGRVFVSGKILRDWGYKLQMDFAGSGNHIRDGYIDYRGFSAGTLRVGNFKQPFSLDNMTSSKYVSFIERSLLQEAFVPGRRIGAALLSGGANWSTAVGAFGDTVEGNEAPGEADSGFSLAGRATHAPVHGAAALLHLGLSLHYRQLPDGLDARYRTRPETNIAGVRLVDSGALSDVDARSSAALELAAAHGPLHLQGEYMVARTDADNGAAEPSFSGHYLQAGWFLTGESRAAAYSGSGGKFGAIKPRADGGAWELTARFSGIDLSDDGVTGGEQQSVTAGLSWYPNAYLRAMLNYGRVLEVDGGASDGDEPQFVQARLQLEF